MHLRSTRECMRSASALKAATRRLSCTSRACSGLHRRATSGAWRMASMCWQLRAPGTGAPAPAAHSQLPCARLVGAQCRYFDRQYRQRRRQGRRHLPRHRQLFLDDFVLFSRLCGSADGGYEAASRAACSVTTTTLAALAAWQRGSYLWADWAARVRVSGGFAGRCAAGQPRMLCASWLRKKVCACERSFAPMPACLSARRRAVDSPNRGLHVGTRAVR